MVETRTRREGRHEGIMKTARAFFLHTYRANAADC
jgi:hypothetical protein